MGSGLLIYGVTGYTGALVSRMAAERGVAHVAAGRDRQRVAAHAGKLGLEPKAFALDGVEELDATLSDVAVVLNLAGPFSRTALPLAGACLRTGTHYLDLAGEVPEFERLHALDARAKAAGVMVLPGVGFGVVPTDCAVALAARNLPTATSLAVAFETVGGASQGTLGALLGDLHRAGAVRRDGKLVPARPAARRRGIDFGEGERPAVLNPWRGDVYTAHLSTSIPNVEAYSVFPAPLRAAMRMGGYLAPILNRPAVQRGLGRLIRALPPGPSEEQLKNGKTYVWAEAKDDATGATATVRLRGPEAYVFSALTALEVARRALAGDAPPGFQTPSGAYGADLVRGIEGVEVVSETSVPG